VTVLPATASHFRVTPSTLKPKAGVPFAITVTALDAYGNVCPSYAGTVHFASTDPSAILPKNYTFSSTNQGRHTFSVRPRGRRPSRSGT
jgi:hypothetical protein